MQRDLANAAGGPVESTAALPATHYDISVPDGARRDLALGWLMLALVSLVGSGVFSVLLVLSRAPYFKDWFPLVDFFRGRRNKFRTRALQ